MDEIAIKGWMCRPSESSMRSVNLVSRTVCIGNGDIELLLTPTWIDHGYLVGQGSRFTASQGRQQENLAGVQDRSLLFRIQARPYPT